MLTEFTVPGTRGAVHCWHWPSMGRPIARVVVVHGYAEHGGRYAHLARSLTLDGYEVAAPDHQGHGLSDGVRGVIDDFEAAVDDLDTVVGTLDERNGALPLVLVGHSMGGLLSARFAQRHPGRLVGAAFLGAVLGDWPWARQVLQEPTLPPSVSDPHGMSRDPDECRKYAEDPLIYHGPYQRPLLEAEVAALDAFCREGDRLTVPALFLHGEGDPFVNWRESLEGLLATGVRELRIRVYEGARHELVHETNREEVLDDLARWIGELPALRTAVPASPSAR